MKNAVALVDRLQKLASTPLDRRKAGGLGLALLTALALPDEAPAAPRRKKGKRRKQEGGASRGGQGNNAKDKRPHDDGTHPGHSGGSGDDPTEVHYCGGLIGKPCPDGYTCVDDPRDDCDPENGGADCGGICVKIKDGEPDNPCAAMLCAEGLVCCPRCGGMCIPPDVKCSDKLCQQVPCGSVLCGPGEFCCSASCSQCSSIGGACTDRYCPEEPDPDPDPGPGVPCGRTTCRSDQICCDSTCGICGGRNGACPAIACIPDEPEPGRCGRNVCGPGEYCCNPSCGVCAPMDGACTQQVCLDPEEAVAD